MERRLGKSDRRRLVRQGNRTRPRGGTPAPSPTTTKRSGTPRGSTTAPSPTTTRRSPTTTRRSGTPRGSTTAPSPTTTTTTRRSPTTHYFPGKSHQSVHLSNFQTDSPRGFGGGKPPPSPGNQPLGL